MYCMSLEFVCFFKIYHGTEVNCNIFIDNVRIQINRLCQTKRFWINKEKIIERRILVKKERKSCCLFTVLVCTF